MFVAPTTRVILGSLSSTAGTDASAITAVTTGASVPQDFTAIDQACFYLEGVGTITGGTILIEEASRPNYSGTWSVVQTIAASSLSGGAQLGNRIPYGAYGYVRVRISSAITGSASQGVIVTLQTRGT